MTAIQEVQGNLCAGKLRQICACDVDGQNGRPVRCSVDITVTGWCPNERRHHKRPIPFSLRTAYGTAATAYYIYGILRRGHTLH